MMSEQTIAQRTVTLPQGNMLIVTGGDRGSIRAKASITHPALMVGKGGEDQTRSCPDDRGTVSARGHQFIAIGAKVYGG